MYTSKKLCTKDGIHVQHIESVYKAWNLATKTWICVHRAENLCTKKGICVQSMEFIWKERNLSTKHGIYVQRTESVYKAWNLCTSRIHWNLTLLYHRIKYSSGDIHLHYKDMQNNWTCINHTHMHRCRNLFNKIFLTMSCFSFDPKPNKDK